VIPLILLLLLQTDAVPPEPSPPPTATRTQPAPVKGADMLLLTSVREIAEKVAEQRSEAFERPPVAVRAPDHMREVAATIRALNVLERERLEARGRAWADVGLGDGAAPERLYLALAGDLEGIGFDPEGNRLLVAPDRLTEEDFSPQGPEDESSATLLMLTGVRVDEPLVSHLLMHVRQRERRGGDSLAEKTDTLLARSAWAEGEANLVAIRYLFDGMGLADEVLDPTLGPEEVLDGALVPTVFGTLPEAERLLLRFVYEEGFFAAKGIYNRGGWEALDRAMSARDTTSGVLHVERPPASPVPIEVERPAQADGLARIDTDTLGEQAIVVLVSTLTGKDNLALQAGDGWVADALVRWEDPESDRGEGVTVWHTRWASTAAADDFDYALMRAIEARFPGQPPVEVGGERLIQTADRVLRLRRDGRDLRLQVSSRRFDDLPQGALGGANGSR
jgi:hypothetical protein